MKLDPIEDYCLAKLSCLVEKYWSVDELFKAVKLARVFGHVPRQLQQYKESAFNFHENIEYFLITVYKEHPENFTALLNNLLTIRANEEIVKEFNHCLPPLYLTLTPKSKIRPASIETERRKEMRRETFTFLDDYPKIKATYKGAIEAFLSGVPDSERHCLSSCRETLDKLLKTGGESKNWEEGLRKLFKTENDQNVVKALHHTLSWPGVHGRPNKEDTEIKLFLTEVCIRWIISKIEKKEVEL